MGSTGTGRGLAGLIKPLAAFKRSTGISRYGAKPRPKPAATSGTDNSIGGDGSTAITCLTTGAATGAATAAGVATTTLVACTAAVSSLDIPNCWKTLSNAEGNPKAMDKLENRADGRVDLNAKPFTKPMIAIATTSLIIENDILQSFTNQSMIRPVQPLLSKDSFACYGHSTDNSRGCRCR